MKITNVWICQVGKETITPVFGDMEIGDGRITGIKEKPFPKNNFEINNNDADIINGEGRVVTVPLVNFHDHIYSRLAKGLPIKGKMDNFQNILKNLWWKLDLELDLPMIETSAKMAALESIRNGVTYIFDHHASPNATADSLKTIAGVLKEFDLRGVFCFETSDRNGDKHSEQAMNENINFFENHTNDNTKSLLGLHASFTLNNKTLEKTAQMLSEKDWGIHVHLCEDKSDIEISKKEFGFSPVERFVKYNLLNSKSILAHGIHLTKDDYSAIAQSGSAIVYNIDSNLNNSVGLPDFKMVPNDLPILIGTDGMHANIARSFKQLFLQLRNSGFSFDEAFAFIIKSFFDQQKFILGYFEDFTSLNIGDRADLIIWDYIPPTTFNSDNYWGHFIYGILERPVKTVLQQGKILMKDFNLTNINETQIASEIFKQGNKLFNKFGKE